MKIMTNGHGLYCIRKGIWPFYKYFDFENPGYWWKKTDPFYIDCWADRDKAQAWFGILNPKATAVCPNQ